MGWGKRKETSVIEAYDELPAARTQEQQATEPAAGTMPTIGPSLQIQGELTGHEDVYIDGRVEGRIDVQDHTLTVGPNAVIKASIHARCVLIEGEVTGDVTADDKVEIKATGSLVGDIRAARVVLAEDARFKGSVDMGWAETAKAAAAPAPTPQEKARDPIAGGVDAKSAEAKAAGLSALDWGAAPKKKAQPVG